MKGFPSDPMRQNALFIAALCEDWREAGTVTRDTLRADRVMEISRQINEDNREAAQPNKRAASNQ